MSCTHIWLKCILDDCHFDYITKSLKETLIQTSFINWLEIGKSVMLPSLYYLHNDEFFWMGVGQKWRTLACGNIGPHLAFGGSKAFTSLTIPNHWLRATLDEGPRSRHQWIQAILLVKSFKLVPRPLDEGTWPKSGKLRLNPHGTCFGGKINWFGQKK